MIYSKYYFTLKDCSLNEVKLSQLLAVGDYKSELAKLIVSKYQNNWIICGTSETPDDDKVDSWLVKFKYIYDVTRDRYETLLKYYMEKKSNLLEKLTNTTKSKFNDTPQNAGDFTSENYTSNYSETTNIITPADTINRLDDIYKLFRLLYEDWVDEFEKLFGEELYDE